MTLPPTLLTLTLTLTVDVSSAASAGPRQQPLVMLSSRQPLPCPPRRCPTFHVPPRTSADRLTSTGVDWTRPWNIEVLSLELLRCRHWETSSLPLQGRLEDEKIAVLCYKYKTAERLQPSPTALLDMHYLTCGLESAPFFIPSTSFCSLSSCLILSRFFAIM